MDSSDVNQNQQLHYHESIIGLLIAIAKLDASEGPIELCCSWFDDLYLPADNPKLYNPGVWERGLLEWKSCFNENELNILAEFHTVFEREKKNLSMEQKDDEWRRNEAWIIVSKAAQDALEKLKPESIILKDYPLTTP